MEKSILKTIGKCVIFGIIWGIVLFGVALIITNFKAALISSNHKCCFINHIINIHHLKYIICILTINIFFVI